MFADVNLQGRQWQRGNELSVLRIEFCISQMEHGENQTTVFYRV